MLKNVDDVSLEGNKKEQAHAKRLLSRITSFEKQLKERAKGWVTARNYADGNPEDDGDSGLVRVNLIGSVLETLQPAIYAKAPEIAVTVDERITTQDFPVLGKFARTLQDALNVFLVKDAKLKNRGKAAVRSSITSTIGWVKVVYQKEKRDDPIIRNRINDTQDNVDRIKLLLSETDLEGGETSSHQAKLFELDQQLKALEAQVEVVVSEGLVVDNIISENIIVLDPSCRDVDDFMQASEIAHKIPMSVGAFKAQFGKAPPRGAKKLIDINADTESANSSENVDEDDYIVNVYEVWSLKDLTVYTICEGSHSYIRPPYQPEALGAQWYPFFGLQLRRIDGKKYPRSVVEQLIDLQDEYNTRRTNAAEHRKKNIPVRVLNKAAGITDAEITSIVNRSVTTDVIGVTLDAGTPLQQQFASLPEIPYNPQMYDTADIMRDIEMVGNTQDASRGAINKAKTATEAEIMSMGMQSRTSESLDVIEDWLSEISTYSAQLLLQNMPPVMVKNRFGAEAVWPELNKKELFENVNITIRAGSTSRPNKMRERDQWLQILPEFQKAIETITAAKQTGNTELEEITINLLNETLHRFDEKLDAKALLGINDEEGNEKQPKQDPQAMQMQQQMQELQQQLEQLAKENEQLKQADAVKQRELDIKNRELDIKETQVNADANLTSLEAQEKQISVEILNQVQAQGAVITQALGEVVSTLQKQQAPEFKTAKTVKNPDGSFTMQSIEE